jgi:hypothetical protein
MEFSVSYQKSNNSSWDSVILVNPIFGELVNFIRISRYWNIDRVTCLTVELFGNERKILQFLQNPETNQGINVFRQVANCIFNKYNPDCDYFEVVDEAIGKLPWYRRIPGFKRGRRSLTVLSVSEKENLDIEVLNFLSALRKSRILGNNLSKNRELMGMMERFTLVNKTALLANIQRGH